jgi:hypothetical protein
MTCFCVVKPWLQLCIELGDHSTEKVMRVYGGVLGRITDIQGTELPEGCRVSPELRAIVEEALAIEDETPCAIAGGSLAMTEADDAAMASLDCDTQKDPGLFS